MQVSSFSSVLPLLEDIESGGNVSTITDDAIEIVENFVIHKDTGTKHVINQFWEVENEKYELTDVKGRHGKCRINRTVADL